MRYDMYRPDHRGDSELFRRFSGYGDNYEPSLWYLKVNGDPWINSGDLSGTRSGRVTSELQPALSA